MNKYITYRNKRALLSYLFFQVLQIAGTVGVALLLNWMIDNVVLCIQAGETDGVYKGLLVCGCYSAALGATILFSGMAKACFVKNAMIHLRSNVADGILRMRSTAFRKRNAAEYISIMNQNMSAIEENYFKNGLSIIEGIISMMFAILMLVALNPFIALVSIVLMSIPSLIPKLFGKKLAVAQSKIAELTGNYNVTIKDMFQGFEVIKGYQIEDNMKKECNTVSENMEESKRGMSSLMSVLYCFASASGVAVQFMVIAIAGILAVKGYLTVGSIIAVTQLTGQVISPAFQLSAKITQFRSTKPLQEEMIALARESNDSASISIRCTDRIELKDVSCSYTGEENVLSDIRYTFQSGKHYAIVGKSGSGKSTLLNLIGGCIEHYEGELTVDGKDGCADATVMRQEVFLFDKSIRDNITLFEFYTDEQVERAVCQAGLSDVVKSLPQGIETMVEENGSRFSGGERQRIALARALLHKKNTLLLDEATSALDDDTAKQVEKTLSELNDTTVISVTHRLDEDVLRLYDNIIVMEEGKIVQQGKYEEIKRNGKPLDAFGTTRMKKSA